MKLSNDVLGMLILLVFDKDSHAAGLFLSETSEPDLLPPREHLEEFSEHTRAHGACLRCMPVRVAQDVLELVLRAGGFRLGAVFGHVQPALNQLFVGLGMKLQAVGLVAISEGLVG